MVSVLAFYSNDASLNRTEDQVKCLLSKKCLKGTYLKEARNGPFKKQDTFINWVLGQFKNPSYNIGSSQCDQIWRFIGLWATF